MTCLEAIYSFSGLDGKTSDGIDLLPNLKEYEELFHPAIILGLFDAVVNLSDCETPLEMRVHALDLVARSPLGLESLPSLGMNLLAVQLTSVPATTESFHQINGADHLLAEQLGLQPFAGQQRGLRIDYVEVAGDSADVAIVGDCERKTRIVHRCALRGQSLGKRAEIADSVLDFLERSEYRLAVVGHGLVVRGARSGQVRAVPAAFNDGLQGIRAE